ncbi:MAG: hypothetical protein C0P61_001850 [Bacillota bacterium]|nr:hypothetical protein [Bacillota bacterium]REJ34974.1 MAG: hypothetical protein DIU82_08055 [Bacillota bacterium]
MGLFEDMERLKLRFLTAFEGLARRGVISEDDLTEIIDLVDRLDELSEEEIREKLGRFIPGDTDAHPA